MSSASMDVSQAAKAGSDGPSILISPNSAVYDEVVSVGVEGLPPGAPVTLSAFIVQRNCAYQAFGHFYASPEGRVDAGGDSSLGGTWRGRRRMGLFTSMVLLPAKNAGGRFLAAGPADQVPQVQIFPVDSFDVRCWRGHVDWNELYTLNAPFAFFGTKGPYTSAFLEEHRLAHAVCRRTYLGPGVERRPVRFDVEGEAFDGTLFIPPGCGPFPALIDLFGGAGGKVELRAALLAKRGFLSLALSYVTAERSVYGFTVAKFDAAADWLHRHPLTDRSCGGIGFVGISLGSQVALLAGLRNAVVKSVVCVAGTDVMQSDPAIRGNPWNHIYNWVPDEHDSERIPWIDPSGLHRINHRGHLQKCSLPIVPRPLLRHSHDLRVLAILGRDDRYAYLVEQFREIAQQFQASGKGEQMSVYESPRTGHVILPPYVPLTRIGAWMPPSRSSKAPSEGAGLVEGTVQDWGGDAGVWEAAQEECWARLTDFLRRHLKPSPAARL